MTGVLFLGDGTQLAIPHDVKHCSDGAHSFDELYHFRCLLFVGLCKSYPKMAWRSFRHNDGTTRDGQFICGLRTPKGDVNFHFPEEYWYLLHGIEEKTTAPPHDGSSSKHSLERLTDWIVDGSF